MQFTLARVGTGIAAGNDMFSYMQGFTQQNGALCKFYWPGVRTWLKQQVCTETLMLLFVRMH